MFNTVADKVESLVSAEEAEIESVSNEDLDILNDKALESKGNAAKANQPTLEMFEKSLEDHLTHEITDSENRVVG